MDRASLTQRLEDAFDGSPEARRVVVRQAGDLADSGRYEASHGEALTCDVIVDQLADAPAEMGLVERWNWWVGALELAHENYDRFRIRRFATE